jgi:hypothetical protein
LPPILRIVRDHLEAFRANAARVCDASACRDSSEERSYGASCSSRASTERAPRIPPCARTRPGGRRV